MITNLELYGREDVPRVPETVANFRITLLKENLAIHMKVHFMDRNMGIINKILIAIKFWEKLRDGTELEEL